jgi:hypothetical protein
MLSAKRAEEANVLASLSKEIGLAGNLSLSNTGLGRDPVARRDDWLLPVLEDGLGRQDLVARDFRQPSQSTVPTLSATRRSRSLYHRCSRSLEPLATGCPSKRGRRVQRPGDRCRLPYWRLRTRHSGLDYREPPPFSLIQTPQCKFKRVCCLKLYDVGVSFEDLDRT